MNTEPQHKLHCQTPVVQFSLTGKVAQCLQQRQIVTSDRWVLQTLLCTVADKTLSSWSQPDNIQVSGGLNQEVQIILQKQAVVMLAPQFVSNLFLVAKKDGNLRPVVNLKPLSSFVMKQHFKFSKAQGHALEGGLNMCWQLERCISLLVSGTRTSAVSLLYVGQQHI